jgi:CheY-like chemotaxis protein
MRKKPLILIVDDENSFLEIMTAKLGASGFDTATARNEAEAVSQSEKLMPDLILMDIKMPGGSGTDAALAIKQNPKTKGLKIAFLTSLRDPWPAVAVDREKLSQELGMEDFLEKTDDLNKIVDKVREILGRSDG